MLDGIIRACSRDSASDPTLITPGEPYRYEIDLWATSNVFLPGHRIRLEIGSGNFSRFDRNPNSGAPFGQGAEWVAADQTLFHQDGMASYVDLPIVPR